MSIDEIFVMLLGLLGIGGILGFIDKQFDLRTLLKQKFQQGQNNQKLKETKDDHQDADQQADQTKQEITESTEDLTDADDIADEFSKHYRSGDRPDRLN